MKKEFIKYLESIGITRALQKRVETIHECCKEICSNEFTDIFVTDYLQNDGTREYENLWFFSHKYCMEAKNFRAVDNFDITPIKKRVNYWNIKKRNYNFKKATDTSSLFLRIAFDANVSGDFKAAKNNCDHLKQIILKYVLPNLKE